MRRVFGYDSLQALELVFLALRNALDVTGRRFSLGPEEMPDDPGVMIARHVPYALGRAFEQHLHRIIDREIEAHVAKLHRRALPTRSAVIVDGAASTRARGRRHGRHVLARTAPTKAEEGLSRAPRRRAEEKTD